MATENFYQKVIYRCRDPKLIPYGLNIKTSINSKKIQMIVEKNWASSHLEESIFIMTDG